MCSYSMTVLVFHKFVVGQEQGRIQELKKVGSFERVRAEHAEKFWVTTPTFAKPRPF